MRSATTCAERPIVAASATGSLSPGELMDRSIQSGRTVKSQPRSGVHSAHLGREVSTVTERSLRTVHRARPCRTVRHTAATRFNRATSRRSTRLTLRVRGVYARCTSGSATRLAAGGCARALTRYRCSAGQGEWHELAAPCFPERLRRLDGPRHRRDPERRSPRRGRRHRGRRSRPRRVRRGGDRRDRNDRHAGVRGHAPAHVADARARRPPVLHARPLLRGDARSASAATTAPRTSTSATTPARSRRSTAA